MTERYWDFDGQFFGRVGDQHANIYLRFRFIDNGTQWQVALDRDATLTNWIAQTYANYDAEVGDGLG